MFTRRVTHEAMTLWLAALALSGAGLAGCGSEGGEEMPEVRILSPADGAELCADRPFFAAAHVWYPSDLTQAVESSAIAWSSEGQPLGTGQLVRVSVPAGAHVLTVALDAPDVQDSVAIVASACVSSPPLAMIVTPPKDLLVSDHLTFDGFDEATHRYWGEVLLEAEAADAEDGAIQEDRYVWTTDLTSIQPALLGTGSSLTVRLYSDECSGITHHISLQVTDSEGNTSAVVTRAIQFRMIC